MTDHTLPNIDKTLQTIGLELMFFSPNGKEDSQGLTTIGISRKLNIKIDIVRKKLKILQEKGIIRSTGLNPKYWMFDEYSFQRMDENDIVYKTLCNFEDVDFDKFFEY